MTMPQGPDGLDEGAWMSDWITTDTVSKLAARTQPNVENFFRENTPLLTAWEFAHNALFGVLMGGFKSLTHFIHDLTGAIAGKIGGNLGDIADFMSGLIDNISTLFDRVHQFTEKITEYVFDAFAKLADFLGLGKVWNNLEHVISAIGDSLLNITKNIISSIIGGTSHTLDDLKSFFNILGGEGTLIGRIVEAIMWGAGHTLEHLKQFFNKIGGPGTFLGNIALALTNGVHSTMEALKNFFSLIGGPGTFLGSLVSAITNGAHNLVDGLKTFFSNLGGPGTLLGDIVNALTGGLHNTLAQLRAFFSTLGGDGTFLGNLVKALTNNVHSTLENLKAFFSALGGPGTFLGNLVSAMTNGAHNLVDNLKTFFSNLGGPGTLLGDLVSALTGGLHNTLAQLKAFFTTLGGEGTFLGNIVKALTNNVHSTLANLQAFFTAIGGPGTFLGNFITAVWGAGKNTVTHLKGWVDDVFDRLGVVFQRAVDIAKALWGGAGNLIGNAWGIILDTGQTIGNFFDRLLDGLLGNLWSGATGVLGDLWDAAKRLFTRANDANNNAAALMAKAALPGVWGSWQASLTDDVAFAHTLIDGTATPTQTQVVLIPVTVHTDRVVDAIKLSLVTPTDPNMEFFVGLYRVARTDETDSEGKVVVPAGQGRLVSDLGNQRANILNPSNLKTLRLPTPVSVQRGELYYIAVRQTGTPTAMHRWSQATNPTINTIPKSVGLAGSLLDFIVGGSDPLTATNYKPSFVDSAISIGTKYWGALGELNPQSSTQTPMSYSDNFNRTSLGGSWQTRQGSIKLDRWKIGLFGEPRNSAIPGVTTTRCVTTNVARLATANHTVQLTPYTTANNGSAQTYALARFDGNGRGIVVSIGWWNNAYQVAISTATGSYDPNAAYSRYSATITDYYSYTPFKVECRNNTVSVYWIDSKGQLTNKVNGVPLAWADLGGVFPYVDSVNTEVGFACSGSQTAVDDWIAKDLTE